MGQTTVRHSTRSVEIVKLIKVVSTRGDGINTIFREVTSYWTTDGVLVIEMDPYDANDLV